MKIDSLKVDPSNVQACAPLEQSVISSEAWAGMELCAVGLSDAPTFLS